ncbi:MAG: SnoaL-like domain-containing protein [Myxococcota bacterium]
MSNEQNDRELNDLIAQGKALEGFERFYADDCHMQENNDPPFVGKELNHKREVEFFASIEKVNDFKLLSSGFGGDTGFSEWHMDVVLKNGYHMKSTQIARRTWKDGKIVSERFYYNKG